MSKLNWRKGASRPPGTLKEKLINKKDQFEKEFKKQKDLAAPRRAEKHEKKQEKLK